MAIIVYIIHVFCSINNKTWYNNSMITEKVRKTIAEKSLIEKGEHIVIGVSGGPDSVCLLHVLHCLSEEWNLSLHVVHINHCMRGQASDLDQTYTESLCRSLGIPCRVFAYDVKAMAASEGLTTEEMGRQLRYGAFHQVREELLATDQREGKISTVKIAVAHNLNDQAETVLMRILRGTGTDGLAAMEYIRDGEIIRPLLDVSRAEIEEYCDKNGLEPRVDLTNLEPIYTRNKIRLELIPFLQDNYNKNVLTALSRLVRIASEDKDFIYKHVEDALRVTAGEGPGRTVNREEFRKLHPAVSKRVIVRTFKEMGLAQDISAVHLAGGDQMIREGKTGDQMDFPKGYGLRISYDVAEFSKRRVKSIQESCKKNGMDFTYQINLDGITEIPALNAVLKVKILKADRMEQTIRENSFSAHLAHLEQISKGTLSIRNRRPGDYIVPLGMTGTKKLQDFFVDEKLKREDRDRIPLVCLGSEVLWVVGGRISENYKIKRDTEEIVYLEYIHPV